MLVENKLSKNEKGKFKKKNMIAKMKNTSVSLVVLLGWFFSFALLNLSFNRSIPTKNTISTNAYSESFHCYMLILDQ